MTDKIGAFYQCYKQKKACEFALKSFRKTYPTSDLLMFNDGGDPTIEELAKQYNAVYSYEHRLSSYTQATFFGSIITIMTWLNRFRKAVYEVKEDYILLMEDDVKVIKKTDAATLQYDINGCNYNAKFEPSLQTYIKDCQPKYKDNDLFYGGCGGCIFKRSFFYNIFRDMGRIEYEIQQYMRLCEDSQSMPSDKIISFLTYVFGGTIGMYPGFAETWYGDLNYRISHNVVEVLHQFKIYYV